MNLFNALPLSAALMLIPSLALAQAGNPTPDPASIQTATPAPALYAETDPSSVFSTSSSSSSSSPDAQPLAAAGRSAAAAAGSAASAVSSEGGGGPFSGIALGVKFGLAGVGFDVATPLVPGRLNLRGGASFFSYSTTINSDNLNIAGAIKFQNAGIMADFFPFHGRFRVSGGVTVYNDTGLSATLSGTPGGTITLGNTNYYSDPANPLVGTGVFTFGGNNIVPRVTIGTGNMLPRKGRFTFESEVGIQYISQPTVVYTFTGEGCAGYNGITYSGCGAVAQADVTQEENNLQNDLTDLRFYPILSFGLSYKIH